MTSSWVQKMLAVGAVLPACLAAIHPANSAIRLAAEGLRLRGCAFAQQHALVLETLMLRGGGEVVPAVAWSQRQDSLLLTVDIPAGASLDGLAVGSDGNLLEWADDKVALNLELYGSLDQGSVVKTDAGRQVTLSAKKTAPEWWPKLTKGPKPGNVKIDWASWKDEDEEETEKYSKTSAMGADDDFDFGSMAGGADGMPDFSKMDDGADAFRAPANDDAADEAPDDEAKIQELPEDEATRD